MEYTHWWGPHWHWFWTMPSLFVILMVLFAIRMARRAGGWRCGFGCFHREPFNWWKPGRHPMAQRWSEAPSEILDRRYARGEITREQYQQMKHDIESSVRQSESEDES